MLYGCPFEKITFLPRIDANSGFERDWDILWKKFKDGTFIALQMKVFDHKKFKFHAWGQKCHIRNGQFGTFDPLHGIWNFLWPNTLIWCAVNMPLLNFFIMCLSLFQIQNFCQNGDFLKRTSVQHFHFPFLVFSYHVSIIQKQTSECILPSHLSLWAVWAKQHA